MLLLPGLAAPGLAQSTVRSCEVLLRDGRLLGADRITGGGSSLALVAGSEKRDVPLAEVVAVLGVAVQPSSLPAVQLAGGDVVRGLLVGGDAAGNHVELQAPVLGRLRLPVDRLESIVLRPELARAQDLVLPDGADEALFAKAALGFDRIVGTLHQFGDLGIRFQPKDKEQPDWYSPRDLVGLRVRGSAGPAHPAVAELCTRAGDRVGVTAFEFAGAELRAKLEGGDERTVALGDLACLTRLDPAITFASTLEPVNVAEAAHDGDVLLPWQRDAAVTGGPLLAGGRTWGRGLGVHSRSRLVFKVPVGRAVFAARVAFDDTALQLPVRGSVDVTVRVGDAVVFQQKDLRAGAPPAPIGPVPVRAGDQVSLEVDFGGGRDLGDRVDWLLPVFLPAATAAK